MEVVRLDWTRNARWLTFYGRSLCLQPETKDLRETEFVGGRLLGEDELADG